MFTKTIVEPIGASLKHAAITPTAALIPAIDSDIAITPLKLPVNFIALIAGNTMRALINNAPTNSMESTITTAVVIASNNL